MAIVTSSSFNLQYSWSQTESDESRTIYSDAGRIYSTGTLPDIATGTSKQINGQFNDTITLPSGGTQQFDLFALSRSVLGNDVNVAFSGANAKIRAIVIKNRETTANYDFSIRATGSNAFTGPFAGGSGNIEICAASPFILQNPVSGWAVNSSQRYFQVTDDGYGATFDILIVGVTGS